MTKRLSRIDELMRPVAGLSEGDFCVRAVVGEVFEDDGVKVGGNGDLIAVEGAKIRRVRLVRVGRGRRGCGL